MSGFGGRNAVYVQGRCPACRADHLVLRQELRRCEQRHAKGLSVDLATVERMKRQLAECACQGGAA